MKNNIVIITENERLAHKVKSKIILLRNIDSFEIIEPENSFEYIKKTKPNAIFFHLTKFNDDEFFSFLQKAKQTEEIKSSSIIMLYDSFDEEILCAAFEAGINEFIHTKATETEFTIRTIWCLQKQEIIKKSNNKSELLSEIKIIDEKTNIYTENYTKTIIKNDCENSGGKGCLVLIAPDINVRNKISPDFIVKTIQSTIRSQDIIGYISDFKILVWLKNSDKKNTLNILNKIQKKLTDEYSVSAGYTDYCGNFENSLNLMTKALSKALLKGKTFLFVNEKTIENKKKKNLINKDSNIKQIESILSPLFYQYQKINEEKLFETKIYQTVNKEKSYFNLENEKGKSSFILSDLNTTNIDIEILHNIEHMEILAEKISFNLSNTDEDFIEDLLNKFIKDFQKYTHC